jgi:RNA-binding protein YhbY
VFTYFYFPDDFGDSVVKAFFAWAFPIELLIAQFMFFFSTPRRSRFPLRVAAVAAISILYYIFVPPQIVSSEWMALAYFSALFGISILAMCFCFQLKTSDLLFRCSAGYCTQNIVYNITNAFGPFIALFNKESGDVLYAILRTTIFVVGYVGMYLILARRVNGNVKSKFNTWTTVVFTILTIFIAVFSNIFLRDDGLMGLYASLSVIIFFEILILFVQFELLMYDGAKQDVIRIRQLWELDRALYSKSKENLQMLNISLHDLKHILTVGGNNISDEVKTEIENAIKNYNMIVNSGRNALDVVLTEKKARCIAEKIEFSVIADGSKLGFMKAPDIYSLFGNILDNAIESTNKITDPALRIIYLTVKKDSSVLLIRAENYFEGALQLQDGVLRSTKHADGLHGYGVKSIALLTKKYNGEYTIEINDNRFALVLKFPI